MALDVTEREDGAARIIAASGEIDLNTSPKLREKLLASAKTKGGTIAVDLSQTAYMDSSGVATLVEGMKAAGAAGAAFVLLAPSNAVRKVLQLSRLDTIFTIRECL